MSREPSLLETVAGTVGALVKDGVSYLTDLLARMVHGARGLAATSLAAGLGLGLAGCDANAVDAAIVEPPAPPPVVLERPVLDDDPKPLGRFNMTFYYMIGEDEVGGKRATRASRQASAAQARAPEARSSEARSSEARSSEARSSEARSSEARAEGAAADAPAGELAAIHVADTVTLYEGRSCEPIVEVSREFAAQLSMQGTGKLRDGRVVNVWGHCDCKRSPCFKITSTKWGTAGNGRPLQPFRTVAVDPRVIKLGSLLYVPALEGRTMPGRRPWGGFVHDGCVIADDVGGAIKGKQLDLFVGRKGHYHGISGRGGSHAWARQVPVYDGSQLCERDGRKVARKTGAI